MKKAVLLSCLVLALLPIISEGAQPRVTCAASFAPSENWVKPSEQPYRQEICLNGLWQFQPLPVPAGYVRFQGVPPELPPAAAGTWESTPIKIPSPWNVNKWGANSTTGKGTPFTYWPNSVWFPSYPKSWENVEMGWLKRTFRVPQDWDKRRVVLHFEAVAGQCQILVNGQKATEHFDSYIPFECDITSLIQPGIENELLVGVRAHSLFEKKSTNERFPKFSCPFPQGSSTQRLNGIWQDVFLLGLPAVRVTDAFVKPFVDRDTLEVELTLRNDTTQPQSLELAGSIHPWVNLSGTSVLEAPEPKWRLDNAVMNARHAQTVIRPGETLKVTLKETVKNRLKFWSPDTPNLYGLVTSVSKGGVLVDRQFTRFGWRQLKISGKDAVLNGKKIQMSGDFCHPFGAYVMSRRYGWAWYQMIKDFGGNSVRVHAQPLPRFYADLADEMGLLMLGETAIFGSSINLNFEEPVAWTRFAEHFDGLVLRDRNHPSVFGWSFGNELFAIFNYNKPTPEEKERWYSQITELGMRSKQTDPTREWLTCDGDEDLRGALPVWSKHMGHGLHLNLLPEINKPLVVGESGGTYYAKPGQLSEFNGEAPYASYLGRNAALAIDAYENVVKMALPKLSQFSASETVWFGLEHLNFGYRDFSRLPGSDDGVFFTKPFEEGKPGMQIERIAPYVCTLNPGWDSGLPLYKPLPMFHAMKAALAKNGPKSCEWDHRMPAVPKPSPVAPWIERVAFLGSPGTLLSKRLANWGVPLADSSGTDARMFIVDAQHLAVPEFENARPSIANTLKLGGIVLLMLDTPTGSLEQVNQLLPAAVQTTARQATGLVPKAAHPWSAPLRLADLDTSDEPAGKLILKFGLTGPFVEKGRIVLEANNVDWNEFNNQESVKCSAVVLYEHLEKPPGAALIEMDNNGGKIAVSSIDFQSPSKANAAMWRKLLTNMGVRLGAPRLEAENKGAATQKEHDLLMDGPIEQPQK